MYYTLILILITSPPSIEWIAIPSGGIVSVECAGDVNSDGTEDIFIASIEDQGNGIWCLDGISGEVIWSNDELPGAYKTECFRAIGDVDLDGTTDLAVGTWMNYAVIVLSGSTGNVIWSKSQTLPVHYIEYVTGPNPGNVNVLASRVGSDYYTSTIALNGQTGDALWASPSESTLDSWIRTTESDVSGNGWSEMGYSVDRGSVFSGFVVVRDGLTGELLQWAGTMYYGTMDISSDYFGVLAVSHFGDMPVMWFESIVSGTTIWSSDDDDLTFKNLQFVPYGSSYYCPDILGLYYSEMTLIRGSDGFYLDSYNFPNSIQSVKCYMDSDTWMAAVTTSSSFHCPALVFSSPSIEPSVSLPSSVGADMCLLQSDQYPTPLAAIAMTGSGPGVCVISTSWPVEIERDQTSTPIVPSIKLISNPGTGGLTIIGEDHTDVMILDIAGRLIRDVAIDEGELVYVELPPGVYHIVELNCGYTLHKAVVLGN
ncbi:MAG: VCBS repeat-containing protein [Candidatus Fermentibacteraceae bacterium]|nr:VCBS repeat-containing protein [Candidatus Fermentibacteraceae bacterium]